MPRARSPTVRRCEARLCRSDVRKALRFRQSPDLKGLCLVRSENEAQPQELESQFNGKAKPFSTSGGGAADGNQV